MEGIPFHTLSYVLNQINNRSNDTFNGTNNSVYVYITYYQVITNLSHIQLLVNLYLIGIDNPILNFSGLHYSLVLQGGGSFHAENITFYKILVFYSLGTVIFNKCIFTSGDSTLADTEGLYIDDVHNLTISHCWFRNNDAQSDLIWIRRVSNVEISGCEFYQNKGQVYLTLITLEEVDNLSISNCLFRNNVIINDVQTALMGIEDVLNVGIFGCGFYQNKGQTHLIYIDHFRTS